MALFKPTYTDKKTHELMESNVWWYEFIYAGKRIRESAKTTRPPSRAVRDPVHSGHEEPAVQCRAGLE